MNRTIAELAAHGNPFRAIRETAQLLMPRRSNQYARRWIMGETHGLGAISDASLATYGLVAARQSVRSWGAIADSVEHWLFPPGETVPGQVGRIDIARTPLDGGATQTTVVLMSPTLDDRQVGRQAGLRLQVRGDKHGLHGAGFELIKTDALPDEPDPIEKVLNSNSYGPGVLQALEGETTAGLSYPPIGHAVLPLAVECSRVLTELAAGTESASWAQVPITARVTR